MFSQYVPGTQWCSGIFLMEGDRKIDYKLYHRAPSPTKSTTTTITITIRHTY